ncbi:MAG: pyridoxamine 5'-phosphate oxidase family protein [Chloroflexi bacterium]|nr:pyridoxamine 5'-phosphate oxidase family protein [Chloroflexota bacterium]
MSTARIRAAEAYIKALRTGESSAAARAGEFLAEDVVLVLGQDEITGHANVLKRVTGQWPLTPTLIHAGFSTPVEQAGKVVASGELPPLGAAPQKLSLTFSFDGQDKIMRIEQAQQAAAPLQFDRLPEFVRGTINAALANSTPMVVAYVDEDGQPVLSLRGSTQVYSDTQLCIWVRNADGGIVRAMSRNDRVSLLYRDSRSRTTLILQGRGHVETDPEVREHVYALAPEVEQNHDVNRRGAALIIDVTQLQGTTVRGMVRVTPS